MSGSSKRARLIPFGALALVPLLPLVLWGLHAAQLPSFDEHVAAQRGPTGIGLQPTQTRLDATTLWRAGAADDDLDAALPRYRSRYDLCVEHEGAKLIQVEQEIEVVFDAQRRQRLAIETRTLGIRSDPRFHGCVRIVVRDIARALERGGLDQGQIEVEAHAFAGAGESRVEFVSDTDHDPADAYDARRRWSARSRLRDRFSPFVEPLDQGFHASLSQSICLCSPDSPSDDCDDASFLARLRSSTDEYALTATVHCYGAWNDAPLSRNWYSVKLR